MSSWVTLFAHSPKARWWSQWEMLDQILTHFGDVELFLSSHDDIAPFTMSKLSSILTNKDMLMIQLAAVILMQGKLW